MEYQLITSDTEQPLSVIEQILVNRGIELSDIEHYLHTNE